MTHAASSRPRVVVVGQAARDLVLLVDDVPVEGGSAAVRCRIERLGGKGANQAVALQQLGVAAALVGVLGDDHVGTAMLGEAERSGVDVRALSRRGETALLVDLVTRGGVRRLLEDVPETALLTVADIRSAEEAIVAADMVSVQLQQPPDAVLAAARMASEAHVRVVLDGAPQHDRETLLAMATIVRADAQEAEMLVGRRLADADDALHAAHHVQAAGPRVVALDVPGTGNLVAWPDGHRIFPYGSDAVVDPTGAGDAFLAGLVAGLAAGRGIEEAGAMASRAAAALVGSLGGHPVLDEGA